MEIRKKIVTIGGGTGSFTLLTGLKKYPVDISAIVSMADDGGSTGVLRDELGVLPPGDVRQCLVALSESSETLRELMSYRFEEGGLKGHSFGNLFLSALEKVEGSFSRGMEEAARILNIKGEVIPVTDQDTDLYMELKDGRILEGEEQINHAFELEKVGIRSNYLKPKAKASAKALKRIREADMVVIGPGNHYCSIIPNLLVDGIPEAIRKTKAKVVYNCNLVNKKGHNEKFALDDYAEAINRQIGSNRIDHVVFNSKKPEPGLVRKYESHRELLVRLDKKARAKRSYKVVLADVLSSKRPKFSQADALASQRAFIRHDSDKLAKVIMMLLEMGDREKLIKEII